ncbi:hypothetical protein J4E86_006874 [Alternaria arbusti]|uniref:uncharacterized protein n=1 Tax=Alternaria arbusti TaxID=232088 RepID=UPI0022202BE5|nr:uncharacterized protein J4E86_006874 [Alternaria arbusti]KAI4953332.1 hypothetical protein J4E86_006874 [Alternaria arbusti]
MSNDPIESTPATTVAKPNDQDPSPRRDVEEKHISQLHETPSVLPPTLPPMDKGKHAWLFLTAAFAIEFLTIGQSFSYGRFQSHYTTHAPFASNSSSQSTSSSFAAVIGVLNQSLILIFLPLVLYLARRKPGYARWMAMTGLLGCVVSNIASSFCTSTSQLVFTQGVLQGVV